MKGSSLAATKKLTDAERRAGIVRENSMDWAMRTAVPGEDALAILARAQLYADFVLASESGLAARNGVPDRNYLGLDKGQ